LSYEQVKELLSNPYEVSDSSGQKTKIKVLFDKNNSAVLHYMLDSVLGSKKLSDNCNILNSTLESINYVAANKNTVAFIDFAWLSDVDDSLFKVNKDKIKFIGVSKAQTEIYAQPNQSSFKLNTYPFIRTVYVIRKTGDFTLAKGFESFVAGPKGQITFLKQGLLPTRQQERGIHINMAAEADKNQ
jgi:phosphate transport system substrate-binding protein